MRLIEAKGEALWFSEIPAPFHTPASQFKVVPFYHLLGSEETSSRAAPVQERIPQAYVALAKEEADRLGVNDGAMLRLTVKGQELRLPLRVSEELGVGLVALPVGLQGIPAAVVGCVAEGLQEAAQ
ncbi:NADH-quinone oxidoreductase subunit G [compost metagenome]